MMEQLAHLGPDLMKGISAARAKIGPTIGRDSSAEIPTKKGGKFSYSYTSLDKLLEGTAQALRDNGVEAMTIPVGRVVYGALVCVAHPEQYVAGSIDIGEPESMQDLGGAITYARRYLIQSLVGLASEEDTDAKGVRRAPRKPQPKPEPKPAPKVEDVEPVLIANLSDWLLANGHADTADYAHSLAETTTLEAKLAFDMPSGPLSKEDGRRIWTTVLEAAKADALGRFVEWMTEPAKD